MSDLLPPSATPQERALASVSERLEQLPVIYRDLWNPDTCPAEFLPYLAWSFSVDEWNDDWPDHIKRQTVKDALYQHRIKGSRQSVENAIAAFNAQARIIEWWEQTPRATPHTFEVWMNAVQNQQIKPVYELWYSDSLYCSTPIPVSTSRVYKIRFKVRQAIDDPGSQSRVYAGVVTLDKDFNNITGGSGLHRYCCVFGRTITSADGWQTFEGEITGTGDVHSNFRAGTAYIRPMFILNYIRGTGTAQVAEIECWDLFDNKQLAPNPHFTQGKAGWSTRYIGETVPDDIPGEMTTANFGLTADLQTSIIAAINAVKPLRSHFTVRNSISATSNGINISAHARALQLISMEASV
ncbi:phage tail protein I [Candidatus Sororendozoicomonas aggregata]|uniref:phage tail protein I n=1 Tax=Candidatus Sororendozoicomonas aggregata TaxID=3073239 RepID=UPI002ED0E7E0